MLKHPKAVLKLCLVNGKITNITKILSFSLHFLETLLTLIERLFSDSLQRRRLFYCFKKFIVFCVKKKQT